ncbi:hypothetical protein BX666DRAFT_326725 [Dichotomocladium elegans]|nr:hypothetical protein BX666DRAFT_326725 [Dichotomocladium elegans]
MDSTEKRNQWIQNWVSFLKQPRYRNKTNRHSFSTSSLHDTLTHSLAERRSSQQTTATTATTTNSALSDDDRVTAPPSEHMQETEERFRLRGLWKKSRRNKSRNNPQFPLISQMSGQQHSNNLYDRKESFSGPSQFSYEETMIRHQKSCQELHKKRLSVTSLRSGDLSPDTSRPASLFYSRPISPALTKDNNDDDSDACISDDHKHNLPLDRWDIKPELVQLAMDNSLFCSPFDISPSASASEKHVLQVGCGDGFWGARVAMEYPKWTVVAVDDRPSFDKHYRPPRKNLKLLRNPDVSLLTNLRRMPDHSYDLVHCRFLILSLTASDYQSLLQQCWRVCKPDGYIEILEMDMSVYYSRPSSGTIMQTFNSEAINVMESRSLDPKLARQLDTMVTKLAEAGDDFQVLYHGNYASFPLGIWGGRIGVMFRDDFRGLFERFHPVIAEENQHDTRSPLTASLLLSLPLKKKHRRMSSLLINLATIFMRSQLCTDSDEKCRHSDEKKLDSCEAAQANI